MSVARTEVWSVAKEKRSEKIHNLSGCLHHARQDNIQDNAKTIKRGRRSLIKTMKVPGYWQNSNDQKGALQIQTC